MIDLFLQFKTDHGLYRGGLTYRVAQQEAVELAAKGIDVVFVEGADVATDKDSKAKVEAAQAEFKRKKQAESEAREEITVASAKRAAIARKEV